MLTCWYVLACSVWHHINEAFAPDQLKLHSSAGIILSLQCCAGIILSLLPLPMSRTVIATVIDVIVMPVAFSTEVFCAQLLCQSHAGSSTCYTLRLPPASEVLVFTSLTELAHVFQVDAMAMYAQPKYSNRPTSDALNCGTLWFQVS